MGPHIWRQLDDMLDGWVGDCACLQAFVLKPYPNLAGHLCSLSFGNYYSYFESHPNEPLDWRECSNVVNKSCLIIHVHLQIVVCIIIVHLAP